MINKPSPDDLDQGYMECKDCAEGIHLLQAGTESETHLCALCKCHVADKYEFFNVPAEIFSK